MTTKSSQPVRNRVSLTQLPVYLGPANAAVLILSSPAPPAVMGACALADVSPGGLNKEACSDRQACVSFRAAVSTGGLGSLAEWAADDANTQFLRTQSRRILCGHLPGGMPKDSPPDNDQILRAFRACPKLDLTRCRELLPEVMKAAEMVSKTLMVCVEWGLWTLIMVTAACAPQDRLKLTPSCTVRAVLWVCSP